MSGFCTPHEPDPSPCLVCLHHARLNHGTRSQHVASGTRKLSPWAGLLPRLIWQLLPAGQAIRRVISADSHSARIWDPLTQASFTTIEPASPLNDVLVWPGSGLLMAACDAPRIEVRLFICAQTLGLSMLHLDSPAPAWFSAGLMLAWLSCCRLQSFAAALLSITMGVLLCQSWRGHPEGCEGCGLCRPILCLLWGQRLAGPPSWRT